MKQNKRLESTAYHEAGHGVVAWLKGVRTRKLSIIPDEGSFGRHIHHPYFSGINLDFDESPRAQRRAENMVLVLCAGPAAQRRFNPKGFRSHHASDDWHQAIQLLSHLESDNEVVQVYYDMFELKARNLVASPVYWPCIEAVAEALLERRQLSGSEVKDIIVNVIKHRV